eukprot:TRINITY_DN26388_c0_g1_i4.p4 TRINITY_DN26388_c0_g1~~TRINITY_DN26388_c0_g1_i4.p4  ORF type:complete len:106 (-),score=6.80 TRINITY_DN26388_c0_g1_i4:7-324(-)
MQQIKYDNDAFDLCWFVCVWMKALNNPRNSEFVMVLKKNQKANVYVIGKEELAIQNLLVWQVQSLCVREKKKKKKKQKKKKKKKERKSTRLNSSHQCASRMPSSA